MCGYQIPAKEHALPAFAQLTQLRRLMAAVKIINTAKAEITAQYGMTDSPAWNMLYNAKNYLLRQADTALRCGA